MKDFIITIAIILAVIGVVSGAVYLGENSLNDSEIAECRKWQEQSAQYSGFYIVQWQKDQCDAHSIIINATVK